MYCLIQIMKLNYKFIFLGFLLTTLFVGGVSATWVFAEGKQEASEQNQNINMNDWYYEENLPGGGDHS